MIPNGGGTNFCGIVLVEILWKAISGIVNFQISSFIQFHEVLHGFCVGRVTVTATLDAKLLQKIISMRETVLYSIFLDLRQAYYALDSESCLDILTGYGVGLSTIRTL